MDSDRDSWLVKIDDIDYPARDVDMIREWLRGGRIKPTSTLFDPRRGAWISLNDLAGELAPSILLTTTPSVSGHRITHFMGLQTGEHLTHGLKFKDILQDLHDTRKTADNLLRRRAVLMGGNAVVGVKLDYFQFTEMLLCVSIAGTVVRIEPETP
jgi:uncharacterized protein YbjQ (UPF0145 family)